MIKRLYIIVRGAVQGVGFRPFVYKLAGELGLFGYVKNSSLGVFIEVEGKEKIFEEFLTRLNTEKPKLSVITGQEQSYLDPKGYTSFDIVKSSGEQSKTTLILPDIAVCDDCLNEMFDPDDRRYMYPFVNCTNCGPRFTIIESLPYDRPNTSMKEFKMCDKCKSEYENPSDRRFHAQPVACPECGPHVELWDKSGEKLYGHYDAINRTLELISDSKIIALKGLGGYQLICDAQNAAAVKLLRERKHREEKPFAVMYPSLESVKSVCEVSQEEERLLTSPEAPIVLLKKKDNAAIKYISSNSVSPGNPYLGVMLPYTPLHHILLKELNRPLVATSGNLSEEPMSITEEDALSKLGGIADYFLVHNRSIVRHADDSIVRVIAGSEMVMRRARGYAPFPVVTDSKESEHILAVGGHLKNTVALKVNENVFVSQHIGDLATEASMNAFKKAVDDFLNVYESDLAVIVHDNHPDYLSTKFALNISNSAVGTQHHFAHIASCRAENRLTGKTLGVSWDGTGYGNDGSIWGGEFFVSDENSYQHIAQFRKFRLPGGEKAIKEARRSALGVLYEIYDENLFGDFDYLVTDKFSHKELKLIQSMIAKGINSPVTSSAGRLFDAISSLLDISQVTTYEGKSAMMLEYIVEDDINDYYHFEINEREIFIVDWETMILSILGDIEAGLEKSIIAAKFHNTMAQVILKAAEIIGEEKVVLSGGCFQNAYLLEKTILELNNNGFKTYRHQRIPTNDGGISLGQIAAYNIKQTSFSVNEFKKQKTYVGS